MGQIKIEDKTQMSNLEEQIHPVAVMRENQSPYEHGPEIAKRRCHDQVV